MKKIALSLWILSIVVSIYGCKETKKDDNSNSQTKKIADSSNSQTKKIEERKITTDKKYNEMARYIAGLSQQENDELKKYEEDAAWKSYAQESDAKWSRLKKGKLLKMKNWAEEALKEPNQKGGLLFYPFSGADFLHAQTLFPDVDNVVMIGLEPIGTPLSVEKIAKKNTSYFSALNKAGYFLAEFSFFRTNDMAIDLTGKRSVEVDGTIHLIMLYLAQLDNEIINYEKIAINTEGKVVLANEYKNDDNKKVVYGNKIYFKKKADDKIRSITYYSVNIADEGLSNRPEFKKYLESLDITVTYLKAASYLMYSVEAIGKNYNFKDIRDVILKNSQYVVQDDSGMPLYNFPDNKWDKTFFGVYAGPISLFSNRYQTAMREAFKNKDKVKPLPFGIGYQFREGSSNLMLAKKVDKVTDADLTVKTTISSEKSEEKNKKKEKKK